MPGDDLGRVAHLEQFARRRTLQQWHRLVVTDNSAVVGGFQQPRLAARRREHRRATPAASAIASIYVAAYPRSTKSRVAASSTSSRVATACSARSCDR